MTIDNTMRVDIQHILLTALGRGMFSLEAVGAVRILLLSKSLFLTVSNSVLLALGRSYRHTLIKSFRSISLVLLACIAELTKQSFNTHFATRSCYNVCKRNAVTIGVDRFPCAHLTTLSCDKVCIGYTREMRNQWGRAKTQTKRLWP